MRDHFESKMWDADEIKTDIARWIQTLKQLFSVFQSPQIIQIPNIEISTRLAKNKKLQIWTKHITSEVVTSFFIYLHRDELGLARIIAFMISFMMWCLDEMWSQIRIEASLSSPSILALDFSWSGLAGKTSALVIRQSPLGVINRGESHSRRARARIITFSQAITIVIRRQWMDRFSRYASEIFHSRRPALHLRSAFLTWRCLSSDVPFPREHQR